MGRIEILHCSGLAAAPWCAAIVWGWRPAVSPYRFRTIQACPKDPLTRHWQAPPVANRLRTVASWLVW